ncbi:sugar ABC transporter substrate-binding protein [Phaeobacter sp. HF9A]|uniref:sugar ABC transporter substrate-binding protein n=1 Tax=Phaeobacter sp. HF9A TaxID=2721561 RepID=UPI00142F5A20|nr:sugar ABC transporter substrate-binding protein [Phaeobacter sp. HF9A]NIZ12074.1 sugar ABC transporter substrate-binding protein [Phaeobacter sp. HF9A]
MSKLKRMASTICLGVAGLLPATAMAEDVLIGNIAPVAAQPSMAILAEAIAAFAAEEGWDYRMLDANLSPDRQVSHVDTFVTLGADIIASWSLDPNAVAAAYTRAQEQGVKIIGVNSKGQGVDASVYWDTQLCVPGGVYEYNANWIAERKPGAKVIVFGGPPVPSIQDNKACFIEAAKAVGLEVIATPDNTQDSTANAAAMSADLLLRHPDVDAVWAYNDNTALGFSASAYASGKSIWKAGEEGGVMVFGTNGDEIAIDAVRAGRLTGTWDPNYIAFGGAIVLMAKHLLEQPDQTPEDLVVKSMLVTAETVGDYVVNEERQYTLDTLPLVN